MKHRFQFTEALAIVIASIIGGLFVIIGALIQRGEVSSLPEPTALTASQLVVSVTATNTFVSKATQIEQPKLTAIATSALPTSTPENKNTASPSVTPSPSVAPSPSPQSNTRAVMPNDHVTEESSISLDVSQSAEVKIKSDFSNQEDWEIYSGEFSDIRIQDKAYAVKLKRKNRIAWGNYETFRTSGDFLAEIDCEVNRKGGLCGIGFGSNDNNIIWFQIDPNNQEYSLQYLKDGTWQNDLISSASSSRILLNSMNTLAIGRDGETINLFINGKLIDFVNANPIPNGYVIFGAATNANTETALGILDNLTIWHIP